MSFEHLFMSLEEIAVNTAKRLEAVSKTDAFAVKAPGIILEAMHEAEAHGKRRCAHQLAKEFMEAGDSNPDRDVPEKPASPSYDPKRAQLDYEVRTKGGTICPPERRVL